MEELPCSKDPGACQFGNFINYYSFNSAEDRLALLPTHLWNSTKSSGDDKYYLVLDIGCNAGNFTQLLYKFLLTHTRRKVIILGIDLDPLLIDRCNEHNQFPGNVIYTSLDIMTTDPSGFAGHLNTYNKLNFDAIFCLSLTMWIHLNHGDAGLLDFLTKICILGKQIIIEPQPWKCYLTAVRRMKKSNQETFKNFEQIKFRSSVELDIHRHLIGACDMDNIFETVPTKWKRKIAFYKSKDS